MGKGAKANARVNAEAKAQGNRIASPPPSPPQIEGGPDSEQRQSELNPWTEAPSQIRVRRPTRTRAKSGGESTGDLGQREGPQPCLPARYS